MAQIAKQILSGSTGAKGIKIAATATPGTVLHTVPKLAAADLDEVWIYGVNSSATNRTLIIEFGGTTDPDDTIEFIVPLENGLYLIIPGLLLNNGLVVRGLTGVANVIVCYGYVHRITA